MAAEGPPRGAAFEKDDPISGAGDLGGEPRDYARVSQRGRSPSVSNGIEKSQQEERRQR
jgi:hypothetical protein